MVEDDVVGRVFRLPQLLEHDGALARQLVLVQQAVLEHVADHVERQRRVFLQDLGVIGGVLARRIGVHMAADRLDLLGDVEGGAGRRALEHHVLDQMGDAVDLGPLVAGADTDPDAERRRLDMGHRIGGDPQAVGESGDPDGAHAAPRVAEAVRRARDRTKSWTALRSLGSTVTRSSRS